MSVERTSEIHETLSFRAGQERHRKVKMRAAELGYQNVTEYLKDLIDEDLQESDAIDP